MLLHRRFVRLLGSRRPSFAAKLITSPGTHGRSMACRTSPPAFDVVVQKNWWMAPSATLDRREEAGSGDGEDGVLPDHGHEGSQLDDAR